MELNINNDNENNKPSVVNYNKTPDLEGNGNNNNVLNNTLSHKSGNNAGYMALYLSLIIVGVFLLCFIVSGGSTSETDDGFVWFFFLLYCFIGELPIMITSIIFGIKGLKDENKIPSYVSFVINILKIVFAAVIMFHN